MSAVMMSTGPVRDLSDRERHVEQFRIVGDALCRRIESARSWAKTERTQREQRKEAAKADAYLDALAMLLASDPPRPPVMWCAVNILNNPARKEADAYYSDWAQNRRAGA